jgi:phosphopantetheinyl transferase
LQSKGLICPVPLFYQQNINPDTRLAVWSITEEESFFSARVPLQQNITHPHKRKQHLAGRYLLPFLFPDFPHTEILVADTRKPFLPEEQYHFSISHCGDYAAAIVSAEERVGIDIEMISPRVEKIMYKFLHPDELAFVQAQPIESRVVLLTLLWSVKEAMFKWWGRGEVDFSEQLRIHAFQQQEMGAISVFFRRPDFQEQQQVHYRMYADKVLAWINSPV